MAQLLSALVILPKDPGLILSIHTIQPPNSVAGDLMFSLSLTGTRYASGTDTQAKYPCI